jgi:hypothetical protein
MLAVTWVPAFIVIGTSNHAVFDVKVQRITGHCNIPSGTFYRIILVPAVYFSLGDHLYNMQHQLAHRSSCATQVVGNGSQVKQLR